VVLDPLRCNYVRAEPISCQRTTPSLGTISVLGDAASNVEPKGLGLPSKK
jgi:hypothetical protein